MCGTSSKNRLDDFYHLAKQHGFRSRSAYKLIQINRCYHILDRCRTCLDVCAAPGGWLQVASNVMPRNSLIIGVDIDPILPIQKVTTIVGDITSQKVRIMVKKESRGHAFEVVLHDGSPKLGGVWTADAYAQSSLVIHALRIATETLSYGGLLLTKVFRSRYYTTLIDTFKIFFSQVTSIKPAASRNTSAEIFVCCLGYKAPTRIDSRLLDHRILLESNWGKHDCKSQETVPRPCSQRAIQSSSYELGLPMIYKPLSAVSFICSIEPSNIFDTFTQLVLDGPGSLVIEHSIIDQNGEGLSQEFTSAAKLVREHPCTDKEIYHLCSDLQILCRKDVKLLLRWRRKVLESLQNLKIFPKKKHTREVASTQDSYNVMKDINKKLDFKTTQLARKRKKTRIIKRKSLQMLIDQ